MRLHFRQRLAAFTLIGIFGLATAATAETFTLELKRQESERISNAADRAYWISRPQHYYTHLVLNKESGKYTSNRASQTKDFENIVKKEPEYKSEHPLRCVAKLGSRQFAFVLDAVETEPPKEEKEKKKDDKTAKAEDKKSTDEKTEDKKEKEPPPVAISYNRLYFDRNGNGDLTDDPVIKATASNRNNRRGSYASFSFPRVDVKLDVGDEKIDYSFFLRGYARAAKQYMSVSTRLNAAVCRAGEITLDGKKYNVALIDYNSNGRFDDEITLHKNVRLSSGAIYPQQGDMLLIVSDVSGTDNAPPRKKTYTENVSKLCSIDGRYYDIKVTPAGDKLTLTPSEIPLGNVTNPNAAYTAMIYGDLGFINIGGTSDKPVPVPAGKWKLCLYTIYGEDPLAVEKADKKDSAKPPRPKRPSVLSATATGAYKEVEVKAGETVEFPFGESFTPKVTGHLQGGRNAKEKKFYLNMSLIGSSGEICRSIIVNGRRPPKPEFTITDPKGEIVQQGNFEYG